MSIDPVSECCACCNYSDYQYFAVVAVGELLRINDDLLNAFVRYDRFERQRQSQRGEATPVDGQVPTSTFENAATLVSHLYDSVYTNLTKKESCSIVKQAADYNKLYRFLSFSHCIATLHLLRHHQRVT